MDKKHNSKWKVIFNIVVFVGFIALIYALRNQISLTIAEIKDVTWVFLFLIPVWQIINYHAYTKQNQQLLDILGHKVRYRFIYRVNVELNFVNTVLPSGGVSGFSYFGARMKDKGVSGTQASLIQLLRFVLIFVTFQLIMILGLFMLAVVGDVNNLVIFSAGVLTAVLVVGLLFIAYIIESNKRINSLFGFITKIINKILHLLNRKKPETINMQRARKAFDDLHENYLTFKKNYRQLKMPIIWSMVANITEILTIYTVYVAFGQWVNPGAVIIAFAVANFAGFLSILPSGLGVYEALMTAVLAVGGIPPSVSIPVTIMYRVMSISVQIIPGYILYYKHMHLKKL